MASQKRYVRYLILLLILLAFTGHKLYTHLKVTSWLEPLSVQIIPINGDGRLVTQHYIDGLSSDNFHNIAIFINNEANRYGITHNRVITVQTGKEVSSKPPRLPDNGNVLGSIYWSIAFRLWSFWTLIDNTHQAADIVLFVVYFDPSVQPYLGHSVGLQNGMIGIVNSYAEQSYQGSNNVIITHELLHTVGATDKYNGPDNLPMFPSGFAEPDKSPLYPQTRAEIMGGRIALSPSKAVIPENLEQVVIGEATALEIHWID